MRPLIVLAILLVAAPAAAALPLTVPVAAAGLTFNPPVLAIPAGTTVEWIGAALPHTVTTSDDAVAAAQGAANDPHNADADADTFRADLPMGARHLHTYQEPGTYAYFCEVHVRVGMVGLVVVS